MTDELAAALAGATPLVLMPASERGWFSGRALMASEPDRVERGLTLERAAEGLEAVFSGRESGVVAVLATYEGDCTLVHYDTAVLCASAEVGVPPRRLNMAADDRLLSAAAWDMAGREYRAAVEAVRGRVAAGDVYVLNLTARLEGDTVRTPAQSFVTLLSRASSDMNAFLGGLGEWGPGPDWIASVSPERFLRVKADPLDGMRVVEVWPIKGTRPRGSGPTDDEAERELLHSDAKEIAEHTMVVDLERNDLGRVCVPGSVLVDPFREIVATPYCHQMVSRVHGLLAADSSFADVLAATFPCGSVTGAPKIAAMHISQGLERTPRGAYCGALLVAIPGELDSSVLIRTLEDAGLGRGRWGAGCGITYESDPIAEEGETLLKVVPLTGDGPPRVALRETMRVAHGRVPLLDRHLVRLARGGTGPGTLARVRHEVVSAVESLVAEGGGSAPAYARLGITVTPDGEVAVGVSLEPSTLEVAGGPRYALVEVDDPPLITPGAAKPASRRYWDRAHAAARMQGADQAILVAPGGELIDGSTATVWVVRAGELLTPHAPYAVGGVAREWVFDIALGLGIPARESRLTVSDLESAQEVWFSNAVGGFVPARDRSGSVGQRVADAFVTQGWYAWHDVRGTPIG